LLKGTLAEIYFEMPKALRGWGFGRECQRECWGLGGGVVAKGGGVNIFIFDLLISHFNGFTGAKYCFLCNSLILEMQAYI